MGQGMGGGHAGAGPQGFQGNWNYQTTVDPEELFRKIFGDGVFGGSGGGRQMPNFEEFTETHHGYGSASEVGI